MRLLLGNFDRGDPARAYFGTAPSFTCSSARLGRCGQEEFIRQVSIKIHELLFAYMTRITRAAIEAEYQLSYPSVHDPAEEGQ